MHTSDPCSRLLQTNLICCNHEPIQMNYTKPVCLHTFIRHPSLVIFCHTMFILESVRTVWGASAAKQCGRGVTACASRSASVTAWGCPFYNKKNGLSMAHPIEFDSKRLKLGIFKGALLSVLSCSWPGWRLKEKQFHFVHSVSLERGRVSEWMIQQLPFEAAIWKAPNSTENYEFQPPRWSRSHVLEESEALLVSMQYFWRPSDFEHVDKKLQCFWATKEEFTKCAAKPLGV